MLANQEIAVELPEFRRVIFIISLGVLRYAVTKTVGIAKTGSSECSVELIDLFWYNFRLNISF